MWLLTFSSNSSSYLSNVSGCSSVDSTITRLFFLARGSSWWKWWSSGSCTIGDSVRSLDVGVWRYGLSRSSDPAMEPLGFSLGSLADFIPFGPSIWSVPKDVTLWNRYSGKLIMRCFPYSPVNKYALFYLAKYPIYLRNTIHHSITVDMLLELRD